MTQATDLGNISNQLAQQYRTRVNVNIQALASQHYGATAPTQMYPCMVWFCSGDGYIKIRNPTNTGWENIGLIGPPMKWFNVDIPSTAWKTGDVKPTFAGGEAGWILLDDGTIGDQYSGAATRANPDTWNLYNLLWGSGAIYTFSPGTWTRVEKGSAPPPIGRRTGTSHCPAPAGARWSIRGRASRRMKPTARPAPPI